MTGNRGLHITIVTLVAFLGIRPLAAADIFYVSTQGKDAWSGKLAEPNAAQDDGPFATLLGARDAVRRLKAAGPLPGPVTIYLRGGVYRVEQTLEFTPEDSGTERAPITYAASGDERPVISGGRVIGGWQQGAGALWQTTVPDVAAGKWYFHQLFVNGQRRTRARTPNQGYLYTEGILAPFDHGKWYDANIPAKRGFRFREGDLRTWHNPHDALLVIYHSWTTSIHFITELDQAERVVKLAPPSAWPIGYWWEYNTRYHVENVLEALDQPGEWYLDRHTGVLSYWPLPGEDLTREGAVVAPCVRQTLLAFQGRAAEQQTIEYLRFQGLSWQHTDCHLAPDMPLDQQGATERPAMLTAEGLRHSVFEACELAHGGENGLWLDSGCTDNLIRRCHIHDLGGSAIFVGAKNYRELPQLAVGRNTVDNNFLHDGSHIFRGSQGVWIGNSSENQVTHNEISDFHHLGISVGHSWGYAPTTAHHNLIAFNHVHHICNGYFSDGGGIYTLGISPGTVIRNNVVHDVLPTPQMPVGGCGIYLDEGSSGIAVENNIVYNVGAAAFTQHYGKENTARNNVLAFAGRNPICCARPEEHLSYAFVNNIVLSDAGQATSDHYSPLKAKTEFHRNLYWDTSGQEPLFSGVSFAQWQATGRDQDSRVADPRFVDAQHRDFRLQPDSPALALGFRPIATNEVGLQGDPAWVAAPAKIQRETLPELPPPPPAPPPRPFFADFEATVTGTQPAGFSYSPPDRPDLMQVTEEAAAGGRKCLKFVKAAGLQFGFQPHLFFSTRPYTQGRVRFGCDLLNSRDQPAECYVGLRDYQPSAAEYREGPSLQLKADGTLLAAGKQLAKLPRGQWLHLDLQLELGQPASAAQAYRLAITVAGQPEQVYEGLPYLHAGFGQLMWFGFSSSGQPGSVFYVDNLRLEALPQR